MSLIERSKLKLQVQEAQISTMNKTKSSMSMNDDKKSAKSSPYKIDKRSDHIDDDNESNLSRNQNN